MKKIEAAIFDMDGILMDSEPFWKIAEHKIFSSLGVQLSDEMCRQTQAMTTSEVTMFWYKKYPWYGKNLVEVENEVINYVDTLIRKDGVEIKGACKLIKSLKTKGYKIGLATNSPACLIDTVLKKLRIYSLFDAISSAEYEAKGKPDPAVYLSTALKMNVQPRFCIAFEDSYSGVKAAKLAGMKTIAFVQNSHYNPEIALLADLIITEYHQCEHLF